MPIFSRPGTEEERFLREQEYQFRTYNCPKCGKPVEITYLPYEKDSTGRYLCRKCQKKRDKMLEKVKKEHKTSYTKCSYCYGTGKVKGYKCEECDGKGEVPISGIGYLLIEEAERRLGWR